MGKTLHDDALARRDRVFDLAMSVLQYDAALRKHPDAPSLREPAPPEVAEVQAHYVDMRHRAAAMVREIARVAVGTARPSPIGASSALKGESENDGNESNAGARQQNENGRQR